MHLTFSHDQEISLLNMFCIACFASGQLGEKPVLCLDFLPGIDLLLHIHWRAEEGMEILREHWQRVESVLNTWLETQAEHVMLSTPTLALTLYRGRCHLPASVYMTRQWRGVGTG